MTKKNKKKTAREKRILVGAFLTAVVIAAGSTFAWFTSTDTVTNRLSANADYNVKIVESFAPPENWMPGEKVDKDVYAVNTGNIEAFAKATISGMMSITREVPVAVPGAIYTEPQTADDAEWYEYGADGWSDEALPSAPTATKIDGEVLVGGGTVNGPADTVSYTAYDDDDHPYTETDTVSGVKYVADSTGVTFYYYSTASGLLFTSNNGGEWTESSSDEIPANAKSYTGGTVSYGTPATQPTGATHYIVNGGDVTWYKAVNETATGGWDFTGENENSDGVYNCVELTENQVYAIEAGAFLAWKPDKDNVNTTLGNKAIGFKEQNEDAAAVVDTYQGLSKTTGKWVSIEKAIYDEIKSGSNSDYADARTVKGDPTNAPKTNFKPHADGLYVFRRQIVVNGDENSHAAGTETFKYEGYYFLGGKYYKITNLTTTLDTSKAANGVAGDGTTKDGVLSAASAYLVKEEKQYIEEPASFEYDSAYNRLIATYTTDTTSKITGTDERIRELAAKLDEAEHKLVQAEQVLERTLADQGIVNDAVKRESADVDKASEEYKVALAAYDAAVALYEDANSDYKAGKDALEKAKNAAITALNGLVGANGSVTGKSDAAILATDSWVQDTNTLTNDGATIVSSDANAPANKYGKALFAYNTWDDNLGTAGNVRESHILYAYLVELSEHYDGVGNQYKLPTNLAGLDAAGVNALDVDTLKAELVRAAREFITYTYAEDNVAWNDADYIAYDTTALTRPEKSELHQYHKLFMELKIAEQHYNEALTEYNTRISNLNKAIAALKTGNNADFREIKVNDTNNDTVDENFIKGFNAWDSKMADDLRTAYINLHAGDDAEDLTDVGKESEVVDYAVMTEEQVQNAYKNTLHSPSAEYKLKEAWDKLQKEKDELDAVRNETFIQQDPNEAGYNLPYAGPVLDENGDPVESALDDKQVKENLQKAWDDYYKAMNAVDEAESRLSAAKNGFDNRGDLKIYIYLQNVSLTGENAMQWQLLPTTLDDKKATFYYTSILGAGEVSEQLIDYVELDSSANQEMYKTFDYDLNITLDSAQVTYADDAATIRTAEAAQDAFSWTEVGDTTRVHNITGYVKTPLIGPADHEPTEKNQTIVSWSDSAAISETQPEAPVEPDNPNAPGTAVGGQHTIDGNPVTVYDAHTSINVSGVDYGYCVEYNGNWYYGTAETGTFVVLTKNVNDEYVTTNFTVTVD